jgi:hypothetical protein
MRPVKPVSAKLTFRVWAPIALPYFPEDAIYVVLFREMVFINYCNLIKVVIGHLEKSAILFLAVHAKGPYFFDLDCSYLLGTDL